ncbi:MAG: bacillithiol system redox-active protein YtxJ [Vicingaceae bacterium]
MNWTSLESHEELADALNDSKSGLAVFFKHSTTCPVSAAAKRRLELEWEKFNGDQSVYYLDLLAKRSISNEIEAATNVVHQSPQLIVVRDGDVIYHASHLSISAEKAAKYIQN